MKYVLITNDGKVIFFHILQVAMMYKAINGGKVFLTDGFDNTEIIDEKV